MSRGLSVVALGATAGCILARPSPAVVGRAPDGLGAISVRFASSSGSDIHAWLVPGQPGMGAVLLLHGVGANRTAMLGRTRFLHAAGFTVLAPDFQAHGESPGAHVTFGALESWDAEAALSYLRAAAPSERIGVIAVSMGGAAALVGHSPLAADAIVLESVYPTIDQAVADRLQVWFGAFGFLGRAMAPLLMESVAPRIGVRLSQLRPIDCIGRVSAPLLLLAGSEDQYTPLSEARDLFARARAPKTLWEVHGAGHEDLHAFTPTEYEQRVGRFLRRYLREEDTAARVPAMSSGTDWRNAPKQ